MLAKSSNQLTFSWQSNGGTTSVERTQYQVELKTRKGKKETCIYIYIYIYSGYPFLKGDSPRFNCTQYFRFNMVKERIILSS